jgi:uncharacterized protein DUF4019
MPWRQTAAGVRRSLGRLVSRKVKSREYKEQLPGAPDGKCVQKATTIETVTRSLESDGSWRLSGYFIR